MNDDALEAAGTVGGKASYTNSYGKKYKVVTIAHYCSDFVCKKCGAPGPPLVDSFHKETCTLYGRTSCCNICR